MKKPLMGEFDTVKLDGRRTSKPAIRPLAHYGLLFILFYLRVSILILNYAFQYDESDRRIRFAYVRLTRRAQMSPLVVTRGPWKTFCAYALFF